MTSEQKIVVGLQDVRRVSLQCTKCGVQLSFEPEKCSIPDLCPAPGCGNVWVPTPHAYPPAQRKCPARVEFLEALAKLRKTIEDAKAENGGGTQGFKVLLEF